MNKKYIFLLETNISHLFRCFLNHSPSSATKIIDQTVTYRPLQTVTYKRKTLFWKISKLILFSFFTTSLLFSIYFSLVL